MKNLVRFSFLFGLIGPLAVVGTLLTLFIDSSGQTAAMLAFIPDPFFIARFLLDAAINSVNHGYLSTNEGVSNLTFLIIFGVLPYLEWFIIGVVISLLRMYSKKKK